MNVRPHLRNHQNLEPGKSLLLLRNYASSFYFQKTCTFPFWSARNLKTKSEIQAQQLCQPQWLASSHVLDPLHASFLFEITLVLLW